MSLHSGAEGTAQLVESSALSPRFQFNIAQSLAGGMCLQSWRPRRDTKQQEQGVTLISGYISSKALSQKSKKQKVKLRKAMRHSMEGQTNCLKQQTSNQRATTLSHPRNSVLRIPDGLGKDTQNPSHPRQASEPPALAGPRGRCRIYFNPADTSEAEARFRVSLLPDTWEVTLETSSPFT